MNGGWLRAAGAGNSVRPRRSCDAYGQPLKLIVRRQTWRKRHVRLFRSAGLAHAYGFTNMLTAPSQNADARTLSAVAADHRLLPFTEEQRGNL